MQAEIIWRSGRIRHPVRIVVINGEIAKIKRCQFCLEDLPIARFMVHKRDENGEPCDWQPRCKTCDPAFRRAYRMQHRAQIRKADKASYRRRSMFRQEEAAFQAGLLHENPITVGDTLDGRAGGYLPREPFTAWLNLYAAEERLDATALAADLGLVDRRVRALVNSEQPMVSFDTVDRALTNADRALVLDGVLILSIEDLYPGVRPNDDLNRRRRLEALKGRAA